MKKMTLKEIAEKKYNENIQEAVKKGAIVVTDRDQADQIFYELDNRNIEELRHRIDLANLLADEVDNLIFSGKQIAHLEWKALKKKAYRNKAFLIKVQKDPKLRLFFRLQENQALSKQLEQSLNNAIDRLTASINVIEDEITTSKVITDITSLEDACNDLIKLKTIREWFIKNKFCNPDTFIWDDKNYSLSCLADYLKDLHPKGYTGYLEQRQILAISKNSFGIEMSRSTLNKAKGHLFLPEIPPFK
ncbi:MAG TPA: hypothetical protein DDW27_14750 [Bacteroidales bacterium]|nr:hypothetical protein [Bacteroidales bacterium]